MLDDQLKGESINLVVNLDVPDSIILERIQRKGLYFDIIDLY